MALTAAIVDGGTIYIDDYRYTTAKIDRIDTPDGRLLSDKAIGQPLMAVPFYAAARAVGADPAVELRIDGNLTLWWIAWWFAIVPLAVLTALMYLRVARTFPAVALPVTLAMTFTTFLLPFGAELYSHVLAGTLAFGSWMLLADAPRSPSRLLGAGALAGAAVFVEYPLAMAAVILGVYLLVERERVRVLWYVAGGMPFALVVMTYQWAAFGSPLESSYATKFEHQGGSIPTSFPDPGHLFQILAGQRGLTMAPVLLLGLYGVVRILRGPTSPARRDAAIALAMFGSFLLLQASWPNPWGGGGPGPRYIVPSLPFLAVPLAATWNRFRILTTGLVAVGALVMGMALITTNIVGDGDGLLGTLVHRLQDPGVSPTVFTIAVGNLGWILHAAAIGGAVWLLTREVARARHPEETPIEAPTV